MIHLCRRKFYLCRANSLCGYSDHE